MCGECVARNVAVPLWSMVGGCLRMGEASCGMRSVTRTSEYCQINKSVCQHRGLLWYESNVETSSKLQSGASTMFVH